MGAHLFLELWHQLSGCPQGPFVKTDKHLLELPIRAQLTAFVLDFFAHKLVVNYGKRRRAMLRTGARRDFQDNLQIHTNSYQCPAQ